MKKLLPEKELGNNTFDVVINYSDLLIKVEEIELLLGYPANQTPEHFSELINEALAESKNKIEIRAGYRITDVQHSKEDLVGLTIGGKYFDLQKIVTGALKKSENILLFCVSIGSGMETESKKLIAGGDLVLGYIYDVAASVAVEACADALHDHIKEKMMLAKSKVTNRYSPGYCNWKVNEQHLLFSQLPHNFCGISLNDSALMTPIKSISGIIGVGEKVKYSEYSCSVCNMKDCTYRTINNLRHQLAGNNKELK
jgi:hypothetical protein